MHEKGEQYEDLHFNAFHVIYLSANIQVVDVQSLFITTYLFEPQKIQL